MKQLARLSTRLTEVDQQCRIKHDELTELVQTKTSDIQINLSGILSIEIFSLFKG